MENHFKFSSHSRHELFRVHSDLIVVTTSALFLSDQDFIVFDGVRTVEDQQRLVDKGASWTLRSLHRVQQDGMGHAVDLVPIINKKPRWDSIGAFKEIGNAMRQASKLHGITLVWGALEQYGGDWSSINDMAHWELPI